MSENGWKEEGFGKRIYRNDINVEERWSNLRENE
jgi:hypothetical protein